MHLNLTDEFNEKYEQVAEMGDREFPDGLWFIQPVIWDDNTFVIKAEHNRTYEHGQWTCKIIIGSENSCRPTEPKQSVTYRVWGEESKELVWCDTKDVYVHAGEN